MNFSTLLIKSHPHSPVTALSAHPHTQAAKYFMIAAFNYSLNASLHI